MKLSNFFKKSNKVNIDNLRKTVEIDPYFYWKRILMIMFGVLLGIIILGFIVYNSVNSGNFIDSETRAKVQALEVTELKTKELTKVVDDFSSREKERESIVKSDSLVKDPSVGPVNISSVSE